jgi:hypothetical protein
VAILHLDLKRRKGKTMKSKLLYLLVPVMMISLGYLTEHVEEIIWTVGPLILFSFLLGLIFPNPRRAWLWGLFILLSIPLAELAANLIGYKPPFPTASFISPLALIPLAMAITSAYAGVAVHRWFGTPHQVAAS